jgi:hypothetical protein
VKVVGGELKRQESEIQEIKLFRFENIPKNLAFLHNDMVTDFLESRTNQAEK